MIKSLLPNFFDSVGTLASRSSAPPKSQKNWYFRLILILSFLFLTFNLSVVYGVTLESPNFRIQGGNVNIGAKDGTSESYNLSTTLGQLAAQEFQSKGYVVKAGFQYIRSIIPFQFSLSKTDLKLGSLLPNTPATAQTGLTVSFGQAGKYQVTAAQAEKLQTQGGSFIPDTSCDGGANACSQTQAKPWNSVSSYGFGYNLSGDDIPPDFVNSSYFRPFPNSSLAEAPVVIMSNGNVVRKSQATMTFKANISPDQATGSYQTVINFVATPSF